MFKVDTKISQCKLEVVQATYVGALSLKVEWNIDWVPT